MTSEYQQDAPMDVYSVKLKARHAIQAREMGSGNLSDGIRKAIEDAYKAFKLKPKKPRLLTV